MPTPNVTVPSEVIQPATLPTSVQLSSAGSTFVTTPTYTWTLIEKPDDSTAYIDDPTAANPELLQIDRKGTYIVFLSITDAQGSSHPVPYAAQSLTAPYNFQNPLPSAFGVVRVAEHSGLVKPGRGEYGWLGSIWSMIDKIGELDVGGGGGGGGDPTPPYDDDTHEVSVAGVLPYSQDNYVNFNGLKIIDGTASVGTGTTWGTLSCDTGSPNDVQLSLPNRRLVISAEGMHIYSGGAGHFLMEVPLIELDADNDVSIRASDDVSISTTGANADIALTTAGAGSDVRITAPGAGSDIELTAADTITLTATGGAALSLGQTSAGITIASKTVAVQQSGDAIAIHTAVAAGLALSHSSGSYVSVSDNIYVTSNSSVDVTADAGGMASISAGHIALTGSTAVAIGAAVDSLAPGTGELFLGADQNVSITAGDSITLEANGLGADVTITATGNSADVNLTASNQVSIATSGGTTDCSVVLTTNGNIELDAAGDVVIDAADDIAIRPADDLRVLAGGSSLIDSVDSFLIWSRETPTSAPPSLNVFSDVTGLLATRNRLELRPQTETVSSKPFRAPGVAGQCTSSEYSEDPILNGSFAKIIGPDAGLGTSATRLTKHVLGSQFLAELNVYGVATSNTHPTLTVLYTQAFTDHTIASLQTPHVGANDEFVFHASISMAFVRSDKVFVRCKIDCTNVSHSTSSSTVVSSLMPVDTASAIDFNARLAEGVSEYAMSLTSTLLNPHSETVL
jgi:hypothetical protein